MKKIESTLTNMITVLTVISIIAGGVLSWVNSATKGQIEKINKENLAKGICTVMARNDIQVAQPIEKDGFTFYTVTAPDNQEIGTAVLATQQGFGDNLKVLVGFSTEGRILGYTLLEHKETPGLGAKASFWFQNGQKGNIIGKKPAECNLTVAKDGGDIDAITAATITSRAFLTAVVNAYNAAFPEGSSVTTSASYSPEN